MGNSNVTNNHINTDMKTQKTSPRIIQPRGIQNKLRRLQRGQSLVEVAFSITILLLVFSGAVDLGRAFFTKIFLDSAVSEGAHFAAAYPGCLKYGTNNFLGTDNVPRNCWATNNAYWRALNESNQLDKTHFVDVSQPIGYIPIDSPNCDANMTSGPTRCSSDLTDIQPGDTVYITLQYRMPLLTPIMRGMFGSDLTLTSFTKLVVRGTGIPESYGEAQPQPNSINPVKVVKNGDQKYGQGTCTNGVPSLTWQSSEVVKGFVVYPALTQDPNPSFSTSSVTPADTPENKNDAGLVPESALQTYSVVYNNDNNSNFFSQAPTLTGGSRKYSVEAYISDGTTTYYGPPYTITTFCHPVTADQFTASCRVDNKGLNTSWHMFSDQYGTQFLDRAVDGFGIYRGTPGSGTLVGTITGNSTRLGSASFSALPTDWLSSSYYVQAQIGGSPVGTAKILTAPVACNYTTALKLNVDDGVTTATAGAPVDYTVTITNTGSQNAYGIALTQTTSTGSILTNQQWTCVPVSNAKCSDDTDTSSSGGTLNTRVQILAGGSLTLHITGYYPNITGNFTMAVNAASTPECAVNCSVTVTGNPQLVDTTTLSAGTDVDLSIKHLVANVETASTNFTPPAAITYDLVVANGSATVNAPSVQVTINVPSPLNPLQTTWKCVTNTGTATCPQGGPVTFSANQITITGFNLPVSSSVKITITASSSGLTSTFTTTASVQPGVGSTITDSTQGNNSVSHDYIYSSGQFYTDLGLLLSGTSYYTSGTQTTLTYNLYAYNRGVDNLAQGTITLDDLNDQLDTLATTGQITFSCATAGTASCGSGGTGIGSYNTSTKKFVITNVQLNASANYTPPISTLETPLPANYVKYSISITIPSTLSGNIQLSANIAANQPSGAVDAASPGLNNVTYTTVEASSIQADLTIAITAYSGAPYTPGSDVVYTITATNLSKRSVPNATIFWSDLNSALQNVIWCQGANCIPSNSLPMASLNLNSKSSITLQVKGTVSQTYTASTSFTVQVQIAGSIDNIQSNNTAQFIASAASVDLYTVQTTNAPDYVLSYKPSQTSTIKFKVGNNGQTKVYGNLVSTSFTLSGGVDASAKFASRNWTCTAYGSSSCPNFTYPVNGVPTNVIVDLGTTSSSYVEFTLTLNMASDAQGTINVAGAVQPPGSLSDSNNANNNAATFTLKFGENLAIAWAATQSVTTYQPSDTITYYFTATNKGDNSVNATIADNFGSGIISNATWSLCSSATDTVCSTTGATSTPTSPATSITSGINTTQTIAAGASQTFKVVLTIRSGATNATGNLTYAVNISGQSGYVETTYSDNSLTGTTITRYWPSVSNLAVVYCKSQNKTKPTDVTWTFDNYKIQGTVTSFDKIVITDSAGNSVQTITTPSPAWTASDVSSVSSGTSNGWYVNTTSGTTTVKSRSTIPNTYEGTNLTLTLWSGLVQMGQGTQSIKITSGGTACS